MKEIICENCGKAFSVKKGRKNPRFCCNKCYGEWRTKHKPIYKRTCPICKKEFIVSSPSHRKTFCSPECSHIGRITKVTKICQQCGEEFQVIKTRDKTALYCCKICADKAKKKEPNIYCDVCGKPIKRKPSHITKNKHGNFCSRKCVNEWKKEAYKGEGNHQYGLRGELNASFKGEKTTIQNHKLTEVTIWCPNHPFAPKSQRIKYHRYLVEQNYNNYDKKYFVQIDNKYYLLPEIHVHHLDGNHNNNDINNLIPCTEAEHHLYHAAMQVETNKIKEILKNIAAVFKRDELLGSLEVDNQQPSQPLTKLEGSETNT